MCDNGWRSIRLYITMDYWFNTKPSCVFTRVWFPISCLTAITYLDLKVKLTNYSIALLVPAVASL